MRDIEKLEHCVLLVGMQNGEAAVGNSMMILQKIQHRASLVAQWLRIRLPMQGTRVRALVWEDPTCHGATRPVRHNY